MIESNRPLENEMKASVVETRKQRLKESCQDFEAVLVGFLFKTMRQSIFRTDEPDRATEIYESMMDESVARQLSRQEKVGLSQTLYKSLVPKVEKQHPEGVPEKSADSVTSAKAVGRK